jgi:hypothetical protein
MITAGIFSFFHKEKEMAITFTTEVEGETLFVQASGFDESLAEVEEYAMGILSACTKGGVTHVLCDETELEYRLGTFDTYQAGEFLSTHVPTVAKVAIVCNPAFLSDASFFEDIVVNRGLTFRVFTDIESANHWLVMPDCSSSAGA